jgi:beta-barrel assembly-enhancing protease
MDTSDVALRRMQGQARLNVPLNDAERLGTLYGGALASIELRDFASASAMIATAQDVMAQHAVIAARQDLEAANAAPPHVATGTDGVAPNPPQQVVVTPRLYPLEPEVAHDFALLRVEEAVGKRSGTEITAAVAALGGDRSRPAVMARADAAIARAASRDPTAGAALQQAVESLQTWVAEHPRDVLAWTLLAQCAEPLGQKLRAIRAEAEAHAAQGDLLGAIDRLRAAQKLTRTGRLDFVEASIIDSRLRDLEGERHALGRELHDADHP